MTHKGLIGLARRKKCRGIHAEAIGRGDRIQSWCDGVGSLCTGVSDMNVNSNGNGSRHKVRDRLCQIIRQHQLDPELAEAYAVDFCDTDEAMRIVEC